MNAAPHESPVEQEHWPPSLDDDVDPPPHDLDAEAAVLGAVLVDGAAYGKVRGVLRAVHFYSERHRQIFDACVSVAANGVPVDLLTVKATLEERNRLGQVGGARYLTELLNAVPAVANVTAYARTVVDRWAAREQIDLFRRKAAELALNRVTAVSARRDVARELESIGRAASIESAQPFELTLPDVIFAPLEPPDYVVDPIIRRGSVTLLAAYGSSGKTWLAIALMVAIAIGAPWLGRFETKPGRTTLLDWESGAYELRRRFQRVALGLGVREPVPGVDFATMPAAYMTDADFEERITALAKTRDLVVIDSLKAASPTAKENESDIRVVLDVLRRVAERTACAFVVLVHSKKTTGTANTVDPRETLRGSSAIFDAADSVLALTCKEGKPIRLDHIKSRQGRAVEPFDVTISDTPSGDAVVVEGCTVEKDAAPLVDDRFDEVAQRVLAVIRANPECSTRLVRSKVTGATDMKIAAVEWLATNGRIANLGKGNQPKWRCVVSN